MSGILKLSDTVLSGTSIANLLTGSKFDYLGRPAMVTIIQVQDVVSSSNVETDFTLGNAVVGDNLVPNQATAAGQGPKTNEDVLAKGVGMAGDRIQIRVRETTGGVGADAIVRTQVIIEDIA